MTKKQNTLRNYASLAVAISSYVILRFYNDYGSVQILQTSGFLVIFLCGLVLLVVNYKFSKQIPRDWFSTFFFVIGVFLMIYSGIILYLLLALQNINIGG